MIVFFFLPIPNSSSTCSMVLVFFCPSVRGNFVLLLRTVTPLDLSYVLNTMEDSEGSLGVAIPP